MVNRAKYRRVPDLYVVGTELVLKDDTVMWLQALNPFEQDEARHDASTARSRLVIALREHGSDELAQVRGFYLEDGRAAAIQRLIDAKSGEAFVKITGQLRADPDWKERLEILERGPELMARPIEDIERKLLMDISERYSNEVSGRLDEETGYHRERLDALDEDALWAEYQEFYLDRRGGEVALAEYRLTEMWYAARCCDGTRTEDGSWDHAGCGGHTERVYESKAEVRGLPEALQQELITTLVDLEMTEVEAKNSARQGSSSASSPLPNEPAASTASTPTATPAEPPGTSPQPSPTP